MSWKGTSPMVERMSFIADCPEGVYRLAELAEGYGVSRKTAYTAVEAVP